MVSLLADENFRSDIVFGLRQAEPALDIVRVQDVGLSEEADPIIVDRAASHGRLLLTHDRGSMIDCLKKKWAKSLPVAGVIIVETDVSTGRAVEDILLLLVCKTPEELSNLHFVPF
ncbi:MAG: DUF5615 family PIN-like protein [Gemmataceae bacterium]